MLLIEATIKELLKMVDENFMHHQKWYSDYRKVGNYRIDKIVNDEIHFKVKPSGRHPTHHQKFYKAVIKFPKIKKIMKLLPQKPSKKAVEKAKERIVETINNTDVETFCSCKSASYFGYNYILTQEKSKYGTQENRFPHIKNPFLKGSICKHTRYILEDFNIPEIKEIFIDLFCYYILSKKYKDYDEDSWKQYLKWKVKL